MSLRLCLALALAGGALLCPRAAEAQQVSEADRQGARDLWQQGYQLQQAGQYAEALDKFTRAQAVFSAPTNLLHMAECQAQLGLLVESAETYRGLINLALPANAPPAFSAAQTQGKAELQQVEARIPKVVVQVTPPNLPGLSVTIDGQPMNVALVGVERPIDPGPHKILVGAPGYARLEGAVTIKEKEPPKVIAFTLQAGGVVMGPQMAPPYTGYPPGTVIYAQPQYAVPGIAPYAIPAARPYVPPKKKDYTAMGFLVGGRVGAAVPTGALAAGDSTGVGFDVEGYFRFAHKWLVGLYGGHDFYKVDSGTVGSTPVGASIGLTTNPEGVGFLIDLTLGYRWFNVAGDATRGSAEGGLGMGIWIAAGKSFRIVPRVDFSAGGFNGNTDSGGYAAIFIGVAAYFNADLKPKPVAQAPGPAPEAAPAPATSPAP
jgi:hypothetical protein